MKKIELKREDIILVLVIIIGLLLTFQILPKHVYTPLDEEIRSKEQTLADRTAELQHIKQRIINLPFEKARNERIRAELELRLARLPKTLDIPQLIRTFTYFCERLNIPMDSFNIGSIRSAEKYDEVSINLALKTANYHTLAQLLCEIVNMPQLMKPGMLSFAKKEPTPEDPYGISLTLEVLTYVYKG